MEQDLDRHCSRHGGGEAQPSSAHRHDETRQQRSTRRDELPVMGERERRAGEDEVRPGAGSRCGECHQTCSARPEDSVCGSQAGRGSRCEPRGESCSDRDRDDEDVVVPPRPTTDDRSLRGPSPRRRGSPEPRSGMRART